jgi:HB1, ASXL, restriction endonuclease HTH domain
VEVAGVLSNQDLQGRLRRVVKKLAAVRAGGPVRERHSCRQRPRRPGWVLTAVVQVLTERGEPMRAKEIHTAVEGLLGETVGWSSIKMALTRHVAGPSPRFVRVARGRYALT